MRSHFEVPSIYVSPTQVRRFGLRSGRELLGAGRPGNLEAVRNHLRAGGTALFSLIAASYVVPLEIEAAPPDTVSMDAFFA